MKKLIAILVVFAVVAGAAFAQDEGSWSISSSGNIGASFDFTGMEGVEGGHATNVLDGYDYMGAGDMRGNLGINYNKGALGTGLSFEQGSGIGGNVSFSGENFEFNAAGTFDGSIFSKGELWGNYKFDVLNGLKLETSVERQGQQWWNVSDIFGDTLSHTGWGGGKDNYLLVDAGLMDGLNAGFLIPHVFAKSRDDFMDRSLKNIVFGAKFGSGAFEAALQFALQGDAFREEWKPGDLKSALYVSAQYQINDQMKAAFEFRGVFGRQAWVTTGDFGGWALPDYIHEDDSAYAPLMAVYMADAEWKDNMGIKIGARFDFNSGDFGANVKIKYEDDNTAAAHGYIPYAYDEDNAAYDPDKTFDGSDPTVLVGIAGAVIRIEPSISYVLVPDYLKFELGVGLNFFTTLDVEATSKATDGKPVYANVMSYSFQPALFFNFLGTGAGNFDTGIAMRYRWEGPAGYFEPTKGRNTKNFFEIMFGWKF